MAREFREFTRIVDHHAPGLPKDLARLLSLVSFLGGVSIFLGRAFA